MSKAEERRSLQHIQVLAGLVLELDELRAVRDTAVEVAAERAGIIAQLEAQLALTRGVLEKLIKRFTLRESDWDNIGAALYGSDGRRLLVQKKRLEEALRGLLETDICDPCHEDSCGFGVDVCGCPCHREIEQAKETARSALAKEM